MNHFAIFAHGHAFDVDAYLQATKLDFDYVWRRGEPKLYSCLGTPNTTSGVEKVLGPGERITMHEQERIAIDFIVANRDELRKLGTWPGVDVFTIGLQYQLTLAQDVRGFYLGSSTLLMERALEIGAEIGFYVVHLNAEMEEGWSEPPSEDDGTHE